MSENGQEPSGNGAAPEHEPETTPEEETGSSLELDRSVLKPKPAPDAESTTAESAAPAAEPTPAAATEAIEKPPVPWALYARLGGFVSMLVLAIVGMYFIRSEHRYVWIYWVSLVLVFMVVSFVRGYQSAKARGETLSSSLTRHFMHWGGLIIVVGIMMVLQNYERIDVNVAANILLLLLALTSYLAGVHFDRLFIVIGVFLGVIALLANLKNDAVIWGVSVLVALAALGVAFLHFRGESGKGESA